MAPPCCPDATMQDATRTRAPLRDARAPLRNATRVPLRNAARAPLRNATRAPLRAASSLSSASAILLMLLSSSHRALALVSDAETSASHLSRATFSWLNPTLRLGRARPLREGDLPALRPDDSARAAVDRFEREWNRRVALGATDGRRNACALALWAAFGREFASAGGLKLASDAFQLACPLLLRHMIGLLETGAGGARAGVRVALALLCLSVLQALSLRHYFARCFRTGARLRAAIVGATYRKLLRLLPAARGRFSAGEITNLMGPDAQRIEALIPYLHALWFAPLQVAAALGLLAHEVGVLALLPGVGIVAGMLVANKAIAAATFRCQAALLASRDRRVRLVRELLVASARPAAPHTRGGGGGMHMPCMCATTCLLTRAWPVRGPCVGVSPGIRSRAWHVHAPRAWPVRGRAQSRS